jgi:glycine/serine hydroxymethyltransferase
LIRPADLTTFLTSIALVIGPTPPGLGETKPATSNTLTGLLKGNPSTIAANAVGAITSAAQNAVKNVAIRALTSRRKTNIGDLTDKDISGKEAQILLDSVGITCNKNMIPDDPRSPMDPSGIRLGTPAMTTRGFTEIEAEEVAHLIADVLDAPNDEAVLARVRKEVSVLCKKYPVYGA